MNTEVEKEEFIAKCSGRLTAGMLDTLTDVFDGDEMDRMTMLCLVATNVGDGDTEQAVGCQIGSMPLTNMQEFMRLAMQLNLLWVISEDTARSLVAGVSSTLNTLLDDISESMKSELN